MNRRDADSRGAERLARSRRSASSWPATSSPPSVVTSSARFGHQTAILRPHLAARCRIISSVTAISRFMRVLQELAHESHVAVLDVPPVLAQMQRDAVGARTVRRAARRAWDPDNRRPALGAASPHDRCSPRARCRSPGQTDAHGCSRGRGSRRRIASMTSRDFKARPSRQASSATRSTRFASRNERASSKASASRSANERP